MHFRGELYDKIVTRKMGGWCFQVNGLFHWLLREVGFNVDITGGSTRTATGTWRNAKDHMVLVVHIENKLYLSDVGFGMYKVSKYIRNLSIK